MRTLLTALLLAACQPVDINPALAPEQPVQARLAPEPTEPTEPIVDEPSIPDEPPTLDPSTFKLPTHVTYSFGTRISGCQSQSYYQANIQLYKVTCNTPNPGSFPGVNLPGELGQLVRAYLSIQGLVEDVHYEVDAAFVNYIVIYILNSNYTGLAQESFDIGL